MDEEYWKDKWAGRRNKKPNNFAVRCSRIIKERDCKTLLDLGCGDGTDSAYFRRKGLAVTAVDFSESGIEALSMRDKEINAIKADIREFSQGKYDTIYAHLSLHYFDGPTTKEIFARLHGMLNPGGMLFVKCKSTEDSLFGVGEKVGENMFRKGHTRHFFDKEYMRTCLSGYSIISIKKTSSVYHEYKSSFIEAVAAR